MKIEGGCPTRIPLVYALNIYKPGGKMKTKADQIHIRLKSGKQHGKQGNRFILGGLATLLQDAWLAWAWLLLVPEKKYVVQNYTFWTFLTIKFHLGISNSYTSDMYSYIEIIAGEGFIVLGKLMLRTDMMCIRLNQIYQIYFGVSKRQDWLLKRKKLGKEHD